ncbi:helix-hairpin-helix domain-containing protein [Nocardioides mesophilus]|uniref:Helix-hairpin-helix domain-containing protein n=1 Tax=Nocardioides mesophilus TaxID=433659 RepID=A0A7G9RCN8_9ACTN|nr:helix-hairpin-helix domain-containing protein [Nocardioides mesophilus]QNN53363.1 helix-hairpin-helix domain-containing protein [Nocardioides mesophilus]
MRSRRSADEQVAEVARRRLELLSAELAAIRPAPVDPPSRSGSDGSGELPAGGSTAARTSRYDPAAGTAADATTDTPTGGTERSPGRHARRPVPHATAAGAWLLDRLPATMQGRAGLGVGHVALLSLLVAVALGVSAWWAVRSADPGELVVARPASSGPSALVGTVAQATADASQASAPGPGPAAGASAGAAPAALVVDVAGRVRHPGIVRLPPGSRVVDALEAAGGARRGVRLQTLNLARPLVDGEQVLVGVAVVPGVAASAVSDPAGSTGGAASPLVNLNTADQALLETLPGVGPVTAQAILQWRAEHGAFASVDELLDVSGIGEATLAELAPFVTL